ncbi:MAG TPA: T9SS type A sorting domain-containing protein [Bacteroidia bacterium]|nr:T9SS type A sorting domain-containing protein [Bacteroidia bacterium]
MKNLFRIITIVILAIASTQVNGQFILSQTIIPANPTTNDTITILVSCAFPSGGCEEHTQGQFVNGNNISAFALHCLGPLSVICYDTDTFTIPPLAAGNYSFAFQLDAGFGPAPCSPGIVPGPTDTLNFTVTLATGIQDEIAEDVVSIYPNPSHENIWISSNENGALKGEIEIFSVEGKLISSHQLTERKQELSIKELQNGFYLVKLITDEGYEHWLEFIKN